MELEKMKKHNPKPYKLPRRDSSSSWSELPRDLFNSVLERLGFADFRRVECVCSSWYSSAKGSVAKKQIPWLILLPDEEERSKKHWCTLFNPEEKGKLYKIRDEGVEFARSLCLATYGNWLFMVDRWYDFYILNLFTHERIDLPHVESQLGTTKLEGITRNHRSWFSISNDHGKRRNSQSITMDSPVFWIDEQTKEYVVLWGFAQWCVVYTKRGDEFWNQIQIPQTSSGRSEMVYKDHKLYYLLNDNYGSNSCIKIFDFSREVPQETFHCGVTPDTSLLYDTPDSLWFLFATKLVVTVTQDVLKVEKLASPESMNRPLNRLWSFRIYKVHPSGLNEKVDSLGNEAMLFELGVTVVVNDNGIGGFKRNSIYFNSVCLEKDITQICVFNLETQEMEPLHSFDCSSPQQLDRARWFLPGFKHT